ncbi:TlpA family protein disulfide reductase [Promicromonospora vindobonensis]|uniref:TlpA family protein disulfide reductase n=1 Tax=Promicromonospora vindobonensis TaxID=195748 RepID=A0ABW5VNP8_9MICO
MRNALTSLVAAALVVASLAGCSEATRGRMPGPVPSGVEFHPAPDDAPPAPPLTLELTDGTNLDLAEQWGERPVVLVFFETWCTRCEVQQGSINDVVQEYEDTVLFVGVAHLSEPAEIAAYVEDNDIEYPVAVDPGGDATLMYAVAEPPLVALVGKDGSLLRGWPEGVEGEELSRAVADLAVR